MAIIGLDFSDALRHRLKEEETFTRVKMEEAVAAYRKGAAVGFIDSEYEGPENAGRVILMRPDTNFTTNFEYLFSRQWVIFDGGVR